MLALRHHDTTPALKLATQRPLRASIGAQRNPNSTRAILDAAEAILREEGLAGLSMDAIARRAHCGKPTLYRWWPHKAAILSEIHERALASAHSDLTETVNQLLDRWAHLWQTTLAGLALRGMLAEAQSSADSKEILIGRGLEPYRSELGSILPPEANLESTLREVLAPLLGRLMLGTEEAPRVKPNRAVIREVDDALPTKSPRAEVVAESPLIHRGEWVD